MYRKLSILPTLAAMLMVMFVTIVPHHHHQAMICLVREVCEVDGCCDDEHTNHSDANHEEDESHCISHEKYFPSDELRVDFTVIPSVTSPVPSPESFPIRTSLFQDREKSACASPPILSWRMRC